MEGVLATMTASRAALVGGDAEVALAARVTGARALAVIATANAAYAARVVQVISPNGRGSK